MTSSLLVAFPENVAARIDNCVFNKTGLAIGKRLCRTLVLLARPCNGKTRSHRVGGQAVILESPGHFQIAPLNSRSSDPCSLKLCCFARFSPDNLREAIRKFLSEICADEKNSRALGIAWVRARHGAVPGPGRPSSLVRIRHPRPRPRRPAAAAQPEPAGRKRRENTQSWSDRQG